MLSPLCAYPNSTLDTSLLFPHSVASPSITSTPFPFSPWQSAPDFLQTSTTPLLSRTVASTPDISVHQAIFQESNKTLFFLFAKITCSYIHNTPFLLSLTAGLAKGVYLGYIIPHILSEVLIHFLTQPSQYIETLIVKLDSYTLSLKKYLEALGLPTLLTSSLFSLLQFLQENLINYPLRATNSFIQSSHDLLSSLNTPLNIIIAFQAAFRTATVDSIAAFARTFQIHYSQENIQNTLQVLSLFFLYTALLSSSIAFSKGIFKTLLKCNFKDFTGNPHLGSYLGALLASIVFHSFNCL